MTPPSPHPLGDDSQAVHRDRPDSPQTPRWSSRRGSQMLPFSGQDQLPAQTCRFQTASGDAIWACREAQSQIFWPLKLTTAHTAYIHRIYQYCCGQSSVGKTGYHFPLPVILFHFKYYPDRSLFCTIKNKVKRFRRYFNIFVFSFRWKRRDQVTL